jgi:class 3 adenylate cyclase
VGKLLSMLIENAGAERGFLVLNDGGALRVECEARGGGAEVLSRRGAPLDDGLGLATAIVQFVARTRESVVLRDAAAEGMFVDDPSIAQRGARSVLCAPLVERGQLVAVVYMENNLTAGAFTTDRIEVLRLLSSQAALSLHNARLYDDLQRALDEQRRVAEAQARFVPREFLEGLSRRTIVDVTLGEHVRREMSILFSDVKGFTTLVEGMNPGEHIAFINEYLSFMEPPLLDNGGFVDSYIGDAIMALFQGGADDAVRAAVGMRAGLDRLNAQRAARGAPPVQMGVGVNTGVLTMGTIGGPQHIKCGVIGDPVNLAARVESLTRRWGSFLLVSNHTRERLADPSPFALREVGRVIVVGRTTPVTLYESLAAESPRVRDGRSQTLARYTEGLEAFYGRRFADAVGCFEACVAACDDDRPAAILLARARTLLRDGCDAAWTGVEALEKK